MKRRISWLASLTCLFLTLLFGHTLAFSATPDPIVNSETKIVADDPGGQDYFGNGGVAVFGDRMVVGVPSADVVGSNSGAAYVYRRVGGVWSQEAKLTPSDGAAGDMFGASVAIDKNAIAVGAPYHNTGGLADSGQAYLFQWDGVNNEWVETQMFTHPTPAADDRFGVSVALIGKTVLDIDLEPVDLLELAVGAPYDDDVRTDQGSVSFFFGQAGFPLGSDGLVESSAGQHFGWSVSLGATPGGPYPDRAVVGQLGAGAYIFNFLDGFGWTQKAKLFPGGDLGGFAYSVSMARAGDRVLVGHPYTDSGGGQYSGAAYLYQFAGTMWVSEAKLRSSAPAPSEFFGESVALSGDAAIVGARHFDDYGAAYVFFRSAGQWIPKTRIQPGDQQFDDAFGAKVGLDGITAAIAAPGHDGAQTDQGAAYVYELNLPPTDAPTALTAAATGPQAVQLFWTDNAPNEAGFEIQRSLDALLWYPVGTARPNAVSTRDGTAQPNTRYYYRVRAFNEWGYSGFTNVATALTPTGIPMAPTGLTAVAASPTQVTLAWTDASNDELGFEIQRSVSPLLWTTIGTVQFGTVTTRDTTAAPNTLYYYRVRAFNNYGNSGWSANATVTTPPGIPIAPTGLTAVAASPTEITLTWTDTSNNESGFEIHRSTNGAPWNAIGTVTQNKVTVSDNAVAPNTRYFYRIRAFNNFGNSAWSANATAITPSGLPSAPSGLTAAAASATQINLAWTDTSNNETRFELEYRINKAGSSEAWFALGTTDSNTNKAIDLGLTPGTSYSYRVRAVNSYGPSAWTAPATATTPAAPDAGVRLRAASEKNTRIRLTWTGKAKQVRRYTVERKELAAQEPVRFQTVGTVASSRSAWVDRNVKAGVRYTYRLHVATGQKEAFSNQATASARAK